MAYASAADKFNMYTPQGERRTTFSHFRDIGVDLFSTPSSQNSNGYLQLTNVLPSVSGGLYRRWGATPHDPLTIFPVSRMFPYQVSAEGSVAGVFYSGFSNYYSILATDNTKIQAIYNEGSNDSQILGGFSGTGQVYAATSRDFLYAFDGVGAPQKKHFAKGDAQTNTGFPAPVLTSFSGSAGTGINYNPATTTATVSGSGSGATVDITVVDGHITNPVITNPGSGYGNGSIFVTITDTSGSGSGATVTATVDDSLTSVYADDSGGIKLNVGRLYAFAFQNSKTRHASDVTFSSEIVKTSIADDFTGVFLVGTVTIPTTLPDSQIDTVIILATSDGGDREHLYEVQVVPISVFAPVSGSDSAYVFVDQLPDTYTDTFLTGDTLLQENLWVDTDADGTTIGLIDNTPPVNTVNKPCTHQGRVFTTDGKTVFFSKSLSEVTTSTGLITSKWEEAWPANNRLDIGFNNEIIIGLLSDTTFLYIGTTQNIYRLSGADINSFDVQCIFRNVGLASQDCWTVVYKENLPAGYIWSTPDNKIIFSDFNNYEDIGNPIYPSLNGGTIVSIQPWVHGPYAMVFLRTTNDNFWVLNILTNGWYNWDVPSIGTTGPAMTYTKSTGQANLWFISRNTGTGVDTLSLFDPTLTLDNFPTPDSPIAWTVQTGWQDMGDTTNLKVVNSLEIWTGENSLATSVTSMNGSTSTPVVNSSTTKSPPLSIMENSLRAYYASKPTGGKFFSFTLDSQTPNSSALVLDQLIVEHFPFGRF